MKKFKQHFSLLLVLALVLTLLPVTALATRVAPATVSVDSAEELTAALSGSVSGDVIQLTASITGNFTYVGTSGKTVTIDGQGDYTITGEDDNTSSQTAALALSGGGTVILQNITLQGGAGLRSCGLYVTGGTNVQSEGGVSVIGGSGTLGSAGVYCDANTGGTVLIDIAKGGTANFANGGSYGAFSDAGTLIVTEATGGSNASGNSYGVACEGGSADVGTALGGAGVSSFGVSCGGGTVNVGTATGGTGTAESTGVINAGYTSVVNVGMATGSTYGFKNTSAGTGTINAGSASGGTYDAYQTDTGIINVTTATTTSGININTGVSTAALTLNKGTGASCALDSITVAATGTTAVGTLPWVTKEGTAGTWYTDAEKAAECGTTVDISTVTALYSTFYTAALTGTVTLDLDPKTGEVTASAADGNISTAGDLTYTWSGGASGTGTTATPTPGAETICTVKGTNTTGSIEAKITVYKVTITALGAVEKDAIGAPALYGEADDDVQIAYTLDKLGTQLDMLTFDGNKNNLLTVMEAGTDKATYKIDSADAKSGVIGLFAWFRHMYSLFVELNGGNGSTASMGSNGGFVIDINAGTKSGYTFSGWTSSNGGTFANASSAKTEFTTPYGDTTITASWTQGSSVTESTGGGTTSTPTVTTSSSGGITTGTASVPGTTSGGTQTVSVPSTTMSSLMDAAKTAEAAGSSALTIINTGSGSGLTNVGVTIPGTQFDSFASGTSAALEISSGLGSVTFSAGAVDAIGAAGSGDVAVNMGVVNVSSLNTVQQAAVGDRPVYSFSVTIGGTAVSQFGSDVTVSIPYALGANENPNAVVVYYLDASGNLQTMRGKYNAATKSVSFTTTHFSDYVIGYNKVDFSDVAATAWYADAVTYLAARGITGGTTSTTFSPNAPLTRGQFITLLLKAYNVAAVTNAADNFSDAGDTHFTGYLAAAKKLGITNGVGDNRFAPERAITRQEMFTLLYNALKVLDKLPEGSSGKTLSDFKDSDSVASYAQEAISYLVKTGVVGGNNGSLLPRSTTTRAQMAQVLFNLLGE